MASFVAPIHTPYQWQNAPQKGTPLDKAHLEAAEQDLVTYTQQAIAAYDTFAEAQFGPAVATASAYLTPSGGDDSVAMANALTNFAPFASPVVVLGPGTFQWNAQVPKFLRNTPARVVGAGKGLTKIQLSSTVPRAFDLNKVADYDTFTGIRISDLTVDCSNVAATTMDHVVIGTLRGGVQQTKISVTNSTVERVDTINVPVDATGTNRRFNIGFYPIADVNGTGQQTSLTGIRVRHCRFNGGNYGTAIIATASVTGGQYANCLIDDYLVDDVYWDRGVVPTQFSADVGVHIGSRAFGGSGRVTNCTVKNSGDVGFEIDGMSDHKGYGCRAVDCWNGGFLNRNFSTPVSGQENIWTDCTVELTNANTSTAPFSGFSVAGGGSSSFTPFGTLILRGCHLYDGTPIVMPNNAVTDGGGSGTTWQRLVVDGFDYVKDKINTSSPAAGPVNVLRFGSSVDSTLVIRDFKLKLAGVISAGTTSWRLGGYIGAPSATLWLDIDGFEIDVNLTGAGSYTVDGFMFGQDTGSVVGGKIRGIKTRRLTPNVSTGVVMLYPTCTISPYLEYYDNDLTGVTAGKELWYGTPSQQALVFLRPKNSWIQEAQSDKSDGQPGIIAPGTRGWNINNLTPAANQAYAARFRPSRPMLITKLAFVVSTAASVNDNIDLGIYDANLIPLWRLGSTAGLVNSTGIKVVTVSPSLQLLGDTIYYASFAYGAIGGTAAVIQAAYFNSSSNAALFGTGAGLIECFFQATAFPLPNPLTNAGAVAQVPVIAVRES